MGNLAPFFIKDKFVRGEKRGETEAYVLLIDLSGFSDLTDSLLKSGEDSCETLNDLIASIFKPSVDIIHSHGGFVFSFSGDGFAAAFLKRETRAETVFRVASLLNVNVAPNSLFKLPFRAGISLGKLSWEIAETSCQKVFYFDGESIDRAAYFKDKAESGEIALDIAFLENPDIKKDLLVQNGSKILLESNKALNCDSNPPLTIYEKSVSDEGWTSPAVFRSSPEGELRYIVSCYISLKKHGDFGKHVGRIVSQAEYHGGYFNKAEYGDKGLSFLVFFGAPYETESPLDKAADFLLSLFQRERLELRAGISYGKAFCGFIGSDKRSEYTALGRAVNMSSKLAENASWGDIVADETVFNRIKNNFNMLRMSENPPGRGVSERYVLVSKKVADDSFSRKKTEMTGRKEELKNLLEIAKRHREGDFWGTVCVSGEAGIGKSKLLEKFKDSLFIDRFNVFRLPCGEPQGKPFGPFILFLREYFNLSDSESESLGLVRFQDKIFDLKEKLAVIFGRESAFLRNLEYKSKWIGNLAGIKRFSDDLSFYEPKEKYDNTVSALIDFLSAEAFVKPVIAEVTDALKIDDDSRFVLESIFNRSKKFPFMLLLETRSIEPFTDLLFGDSGEVHNIKLSPLDEFLSRECFFSFCRALNIENRMSKFRRSYLDSMIAKTAGNPLFIENMALFLSYKSSELPYQTEADDKLDQSVPSEIEHIILARFDTLDTETKDALRIASVLGQIFSKEMFSDILKEHFPEIDPMNSLLSCQKNNFIELSGNSCHFSNPLIREVIYGIQPKSFLQKTHYSAARCLERDHIDDHSYLEEITAHFCKSGYREKSLEYLIKTSEYLHGEFHENRALALLEEAEKNYGRKDPVTLNKIFYLKGSALKNLGKWEISSHVFRKALSNAYNNRMVREYAENLESLSSLFRRTGKSGKSKNYAKRALTLAAKAGDEKLIFMSNNDLGLLHYRKGEYDKALFHFEKCEKILNGTQDKKEIPNVLHNISLIHAEKGELDTALEKALEALDKCSQAGNLRSESRILLNLGGIYHAMFNFQEAEKYYERSLDLKKKIGDTPGEVMVKCNLGVIKKDLGRLDEAQRIFEECMDINTQIGNNRNFAVNLINIADIKKISEKYEDSISCYEKSYEILKASNLNFYLCYGLVQKTDALYELGRYEEAERYLSEAMDISDNIQNPAFISSCNILRIKIDIKNNLSVDTNLAKLKEIAQSDENNFIRAYIYYDLYRLTGKKEFAEKAYELFVDLHASVPKYEYKIFLEKLRQIAQRFASGDGIIK
ncbi:tetratricopeptide repeat protein [candidate division WOR-3 bacterium]|nr:tetratricopeptide repeat protein [candidate division WOR-3 bacterium]